MWKSGRHIFYSPLSPSIQPVCCCYVLLPTSGRADAMQDVFGDAGTTSLHQPLPKGCRTMATTCLIHCPLGTCKPAGPPCPVDLRCPGALLGRTWLAATQPGEREVLSRPSPSPLSPQIRLCSVAQIKKMQEWRRCCILADVGLKALGVAGAAVPHSFGTVCSHVPKGPLFCHGSSHTLLPLIPTPRMGTGLVSEAQT